MSLFRKKKDTETEPVEKDKEMAEGQKSAGKQHNPSVASDSLSETMERMKISEADKKKKNKRSATLPSVLLEMDPLVLFIKPRSLKPVKL